MPISQLFQKLSQWSGKSVQRRSVIWSLAFWVLSVSVISLSVLFIGQREILNETSQRNVQLASVISRDVNAQVSGIYSDARIFSQYLGALSPALDEQANAILALRLSSPQRYRAVYYFDAGGNLLLHLTDTLQDLLLMKDAGSIISRPPIPVNEPISIAYNQVSNTGTYISNVYFTGIERIPVFYIGMPVIFSGGEKRIVITEIDLRDVWQRIGLSTIGQSGHTYAVSRSGIIIAHPDAVYIGRSISSEISPVVAGYEGFTEYTEPLEKRPVFAAYSPVGGVTGWSIVVEQDAAEVREPLIRIGVITVSIWIALGIIGTLGILAMIKNFTKPIVNLTRTTQNIARTGELTRTSTMQRPDEIGQLSRAFDSMIDRLQTTEDNLKISEEKYRSIVENSHGGIFIVDEVFRFNYANNMLSEILGYPMEEIIGSDFRKYLDEESRKLVADRYIRRQRGEDVPSRYEFSIIRKNGEKRHVEISSEAITDAHGKIRTVGQILDVTERKKTTEELRKAHEELENRVLERTAELRQANTLLQNEIARHESTQLALRQSELKYRHLIESTNTIILEMDVEGKITFFNRFAEEFFGFSGQEIAGKSVVGTIVPATDSSGKGLKLMIDNIVSNPEKYRHNENENIRRNGERVWIVWSNQPHYDKDGRLLGILCVGIDRTEQKKGEEILARQTREKAATEERSRLARDLHDAVSQTLFSASLISEVLPRLWERNQNEGRKRLEEVRQLTRGALAEMRTLLLELRPASLAEAELGYLLRQLGESITGRSRVPVMLTIEGENPLPTEVKIALYRIAQEALNNVAKHSGASQAQLNLHCQPGRVELNINDNGDGFDLSQLPANSLGLGIMRERAKDIGASLNIESKINGGTVVTIVWQNPQKER